MSRADKVKGDKLSVITDKFNGCIKRIARIYKKKKEGTPDEEKAHRIIMRLNIVSESIPTFMIDACGPFFLKYAHIIKSRNWDVLMEMDFAEEKKTYGVKADDGREKTNEVMDSHILFIKNCFKAAPPEEVQIIGDITTEILSTYCEYVLLLKEGQ